MSNGHCQENRKKLVNYVPAVKNNEPTLLKEMKEYFEWAASDPIEKKNLDIYSSCDGEHARIISRTVEVTKEIGWYESKKNWKQLSSFIRVARLSERNGVTSKEIEYFISSTAGSAQRC